MKKFLKLTAFLLVCIIILGESIPLVQADTKDSYTAPSETNSFVSNYYVGATDQDAPFFDVILPQIAENIKENNTHTITSYYDALPVLDNPENFQGLGHTTYANINGKTVTAEAFFRIANESSSDPNNGMGLLIYQCIEYKRAHPDEDVKITFSSYRTSCTASVCVIPESKYYGYMRSLYGTNYDEQGFVRISYMLTEAARMGIEVTLVNQLNSYAVKQYDPSTKSLKNRSAMSYKTYFSRALNTECYDSYAPGKKVSDFMDCANVEWTIDEMTSDMQHLKSATVSHYLATDGTEHTNAVFFSSANLDDNNYKGCNGNNKAQSGVIISDHDEIYRVTYNYTKLMAAYREQEEIYELRDLVNKMNNEQYELITSGNADKIPADEQILYLGTESDKVFELYFTPFGGDVDTWDTELNPFCKYLEKFSQSEDYVELTWNEYGFGTFNIGNTLEDKLEKIYCENPNVNNKLTLQVPGFDSEAIQQLALGTEIGYRYITDGSKVHSKDFLMSYVEDGVRHNVSLLTSCNFYTVAFSYRTNSALVINETEETGGDYYRIAGEKYSYGMLNYDLMVNPANLALEKGDTYTPEVTYSGEGKLTWSSSKSSVAKVSSTGVITAVKTGTATITVTDGTYKDTIEVTVTACNDCYSANGLTFSLDEKYVLSQYLPSIPQTFEAEFSIDESDLKDYYYSALLSSEDGFENALIYYINKYGNPCVGIRNTVGHDTKLAHTFSNVFVATGEKVHLSITIDPDSKTLSCYINGELCQTINAKTDNLSYEQKYKMIVGGEYRCGNMDYFPGTIYSVSLWGDVRTATEIASDYSGSVNTTDTKLYASYDLTQCTDCLKLDKSSTGNDLEYIPLWMDESEVEPVGDYDYSFAVIGDTQTLALNDPDALSSIYDWILENQEEKNIQYVIGLGDITDKSTDAEWQAAMESINKLNGKIPYVVSRGNHDTTETFNQNFDNDFYKSTIDGYMTEGDYTNTYRYFSIKGTDYLILTLDFAPNDAVIEWANQVIESHPNHKVIAITHAYMYRDGTTLDADGCFPPSYYESTYPGALNGDEMWEKCFSKHENVLMVLSGHDPWQDIVYRQDTTVNCNVVTQMLIDPQYLDKYIGSTGMVAMFYFSNDGNTLTVRYYSVEKECYGSLVSQFTIDLGAQHSYTSNSIKSNLTEDGYSVTICDNCNQIESMQIVYHPETIALSGTEFIADGTEAIPTVSVLDAKGNKLTEDVDYIVEYDPEPISVGQHSVTVNFIGNYTGTKSLSYTVSLSHIEDISNKQTATSIQLSWTKVPSAQGYEISMYNAETDSWDVVASTNKAQYLISSLLPETEYKFKVRAYAQNSDGTNIWSEYSETVEITTLELRDLNVYTDEDTSISIETYIEGSLAVKVIDDISVIGSINESLTDEEVNAIYELTLEESKPDSTEEMLFTVSIPVDDEYTVYQLMADGTLIDIQAVYKDDCMTFITDSLGTYVLTDEVYQLNHKLGDVNMDGVVNIKDVTEIQKYLASLAELSEEQVLLADFDQSGVVNIKDATAIQKMLAGLSW